MKFLQCQYKKYTSTANDNGLKTETSKEDLQFFKEMLHNTTRVVRKYKLLKRGKRDHSDHHHEKNPFSNHVTCKSLSCKQLLVTILSREDDERIE